MRRIRGAPMGISLATISLVVIACGAPDQTPSLRKKTTFDSTPSPTAASNGPDEDLGNFGAGGGSQTPDVNVDSACAASTTKAQNSPVNLVFMLDRSTSMLDSGKWTAATLALKAFFGDASVAGLRASLSFFAQDDIANNDEVSCKVADYTKPSVPMGDLPNGAIFGAAIDAIVPSKGTPTLPALEGALAYGKEIRAATPEAKVVVVLVTDGQPSACDSSVKNVSNAAAKTASEIPTYVIGVGDSLTALNAVAASGGTKEAVIVSTTDPAKISADFGKAIADIRQKALGCDFKLPSAPEGQTFDLTRVNVQFTPSGGKPTALAYNADCQGGSGWHYDDAKAPSKILVCDNSCSSVKVDLSGKIDILFGCATKGGVIK
jgi:Mg-chelatase subunit ChlD